MRKLWDWLAVPLPSIYYRLCIVIVLISDMVWHWPGTVLAMYIALLFTLWGIWAAIERNGGKIIIIRGSGDDE